MSPQVSFLVGLILALGGWLFPFNLAYIRWVLLPISVGSFLVGYGAMDFFTYVTK